MSGIAEGMGGEAEGVGGAAVSGHWGVRWVGSVAHVPVLLSCWGCMDGAASSACGEVSANWRGGGAVMWVGLAAA
eukprot:1156788-Pelagomonas_calceolata.AAC.6